MEETPLEEWYYTQGDDRIGPVSYAALKSLASDGILNPRHDMIWMAGMPDWKPAGEIEGLFERRTPVVEQESLAPPADSYKPPDDHSAAEIMGRQTDWPGARRRSFWFMTLIFPILWVVGVSFLTPKLMEIEYAQDTMPMIILGINFVPVLLAIAIYLKRFVNLGMSRWWFLGIFVPFLNVWVGYRTYCCPGGFAFHKKLDGIGLVLAILYWLFVVLNVLVIIAAIAVMMGMIGDPELKKQLQEAFEQASAMER